MILVKYLSQSGAFSRRKAEDAIKYHKVSVNGKIIDDPSYEVKEQDSIFCDNNRVLPIEHDYVLFYKNSGSLTTKYDSSGRQTVMDAFAPSLAKKLDPVGRLDFHTTGALLLTTDGDLAYRLTHPKYLVRKTYEVTTSRSLDEDIIAVLRKGVKIENFFVRPDKVYWRSDRPCYVTITIHTGQNRVIKRIMEQLNIFVKKLHRKEFAGITLLGLKPGEWRSLTKSEIDFLKKQEVVSVQKTPHKKVSGDYDKMKKMEKPETEVRFEEDKNLVMEVESFIEVKSDEDKELLKEVKADKKARFDKDSKPARDERPRREGRFDKDSRPAREERPYRESRFDRDSRPARDSRSDKDRKSSRENDDVLSSLRRKKSAMRYAAASGKNDSFRNKRKSFAKR